MAETPPAYGPVKKSNSTTIIFIVLGVCAVCCVLGIVGVVGAGLWGAKKAKNMIACTIGFQEVALALEEYTKDHNGKFPDAKTWQDDLRPYYKTQIAKDKEAIKMFGAFEADGEWVCKDESGTGMTGIAFNSDLSGTSVKDMKNKRSTVILFEQPKVGTNLSRPYEELSLSSSPKIMGSPRGWITVNGNFRVEGGNGQSIKFD